MSLDFQPIDAPLGAWGTGLDLSQPLSDADRDALLAALDEHLLVVFRGYEQSSEDDFIRFGRTFGEPIRWVVPEWRVPDKDDLVLMSNVVEGGRPIGMGDTAEIGWHTNYSFLPNVAMISMLLGVEVTQDGGDTYFANLHRAYDDLDEATIERLREVEMVSSIHGRAGSTSFPPGTQIPEAAHPIVRRSRNGERFTLYDVGPSNYARFTGMSEEEGERLINELALHATQEKYVYRHKWQPGDLIVWDGISTLHRRDSFDRSARRVLRRMDIAEPVATGRDVTRVTAGSGVTA